MAGLNDAKSYMSKREIPQLFESLMTALMYQKPDDHIQFLGDCLSKAKKEPKINWHTFIEPLPPIPSSGEKIHSENEGADNGKSSPVQNRVLASPILKKPDPLPPIAVNGDNESQKSDNLSGEIDKVSEDAPIKPSSPLTSIYTIPSIDDDEGLEERSITPQASIPIPVYSDIPEMKDDNHDDINTTAAETANVHDQKEEVEIKPPVIFILGGPGCGKGTQCTKIVENFGYVHLSAGDLLRGEVAKGTETGKLIDNIIKEGQLVPQEITIRLLKEAMLALPDVNGFLVDGFPREIAQGVQFEDEVKICTGLMMFDCDDETLVARLLNRAATSGRTDDNEETIKKRLALFHEKTMPVVEHYGQKVMRINANRSIDEIYEDVKSHMNKLTAQNEDIDQLGEAVALLEAEGKLSSQQDQELVDEAKVPAQTEGVQEEVILPENEVVLGDRGVSRDFAKNVLQGKEIIFVIGGPGCGKGTQCAFIVEKFGHTHLSIGDLLRKEVESKSDVGSSLSACMEKGELVPRHLVIRVLMNTMIADENSQKFLIDGYPRELIQGEEFEKEIAECTRVLYFHCPPEIMVKRLMKRAETSGRADDNEETIKKRLAVFEEEVTPIVRYYQKKEKLSQISAVGTPQEIFELVCQELQKSSDNKQLKSEKNSEEPEKSPEESDKKVEESDKKVEESDKQVEESEKSSEESDNQVEESAKGSEELDKKAEESDKRPEESEKISEESDKKVKELDADKISTMDRKEALKDANIVFVLGGPGSGKGTQCEKIIEKYGFCHLSTGDLLREEVQSGSKRAEALKEIMGKGELVSQDTILELLSEAMIKKKDSKGFLIDGFPRDVPQGEKFEREVGTCKFILFFDCSNECMVERLLGRAKTSGRVDDNEETIKKRLHTFEEQTLPVLDVYEKDDKVRRINAERGVDDIFKDVTLALDVLF